MPSRPSAAAPTDPLASIIELLRPAAVVSKIISGAGRWSVRYAAHQDPGFCVVLEGSCFLDVEGVGAVELREGDFVLLPATPGFTLASDLRLAPTLVEPVVGEEVRHGTKAGPPTMRQLGGSFRFDRGNVGLLRRSFRRWSTSDAASPAPCGFAAS